MQRRRYYNNNLNYPTSSPMLSASFMDGRWKQFHRGRERRGERNPTIIITYQNSPQISKRWCSHETSHRNKMFIITIPIVGHDKKLKRFENCVLCVYVIAIIVKTWEQQGENPAIGSNEYRAFIETPHQLPPR